jgi:hypothetical protein
MFGIGGGGGFLGTGINKNASDPVSNALSNNPISQGISKGVQGAGNIVDQGLVSLDKTVGKVIPGGWGTVGMMAGSAMGLPTPMMVGMGALNGSGVLRKGGKFNLQGAMMGGAMAYGMSELGEYMRAAAPTETAMLPVSEAGSSVGSSGVNAATGEIGSGLAGNSSGMVVDPSTLTSGNTAALNSLSAPLEAGAGTGLQVAPPPSIGSQIMSGNFGDALSQVGTNISEGVSNLGTRVADTATDAYKSLGNFADKATTLDTYGNAIDKGMSNAGQTGSGIKNLLGAGEMTAKEAAALAAKSGVSPMMATAATVYGATGLAGLEEQRKLLDEQKATNAISQAEYDKAMAEITRSENVARNAVKESPFSTNPNRDVSIGDTYYGRTGANENLYARNNSTLYNKGGEVKHFFFGGMTGSGSLGPIIGSLEDKIKAEEAKNLVSNNPLNITADTSAPPGPNIFPKGLAISINNSSPMRAEDLTSYLSAQDNNNARDLVASNPLNTQAPTNFVNGRTLYEKMPELETLYDKFKRHQYAAGGGVDSLDDQTGMPNRSPVDGLAMGGMGYAAGGTARFLSGGGDGMSDSIPATIEGKQEARLADGEFIISSDVVSGLGNGSSKAGAKQLYAMMDRVRAARTGKKKQAPVVNPRKLMPA